MLNRTMFDFNIKKRGTKKLSESKRLQLKIDKY